MATITARKVDDEHYALLSEAAAANGRSISEELRIMIADRASRLKAEKVIAELREIRGRLQGHRSEFPDSVALVRAIRDEE